MVVTNEPVRGGYPPPGFYSLSGLEQVRALVRGFIPRPPLHRLLGIRLSHAAAGSATLAKGASPWLQTSADAIQLVTFACVALHYGARTVAPAGHVTSVRSVGLNNVRRASVSMEAL